MRKTEFANEEYYHIFNRGVDKRIIFQSQKDYERFLISMELLNDRRNNLMVKWRDFKKFNPRAKLLDFPEFNSSKRERLVDLMAYCLNPNHKHLIMKQLVENGVQLYMHKLSTSYTNYFNVKYKRSGSLFQGPFKSVHINSNRQLLYLSAYVNSNHFIHGYKAENDWEYSSLWDYLGRRSDSMCNLEPILNQFKTINEYEKFIRDNALYMKEKKKMREYLLE